MAEDSEANGSARTELGVEEFERLLDTLDFDAAATFLTRRQATVLAMRERGYDQGVIAKHLDCSRANVSNIERSARENIAKAHETVSFGQLLSAPVRVELPAELPLHEVPERIYEACDAAGVKVQYGAPELSRKVSSSFEDADREGILPDRVVVTVTTDGEIHVLTPSS